MNNEQMLIRTDSGDRIQWSGAESADGYVICHGKCDSLQGAGDIKQELTKFALDQNSTIAAYGNAHFVTRSQYLKLIATMSGWKDTCISVFPYKLIGGVAEIYEQNGSHIWRRTVRLKYTIKKQRMRRDSGMKGKAYCVSIMSFSDYEDGDLIYKVNGYEYPILKEMLGRAVYIQGGEPEIRPAPKCGWLKPVMC